METGKAMVLRYLRGLKSIDRSGSKFGEESIEGEYNRIDFSDAEGGKLVIKSPEFTNYLDLSDGEFNKVVLEGWFNIVDASGARIKLFNTRRAEIVDLDDSKAEIEERRK